MNTTLDRFFIAFDTVVTARGVGLCAFCRQLGTRHTSFIKQREDHTRNIIRPYWLEILVVEYGVSPLWLLTGEGKMVEKTPFLQPRASKQSANKVQVDNK